MLGVTNYICNANPIQIEGNIGDVYTFSKYDYENGWFQFVLFYDKDMNYLGYTTVGNNNQFKVTVDKAKYIFVGFPIKNINDHVFAATNSLIK